MITLERQSILNSEISAADSQIGIVAALKRVAHEFSFSHVTLQKAPKHEDMLLSRLIVATSLPAEYVMEFDRAKLLHKCPAAPIIAESALPFSWSIDDKDPRRGLAFSKQLLDLQRRFGIPAHVAMGLNSGDGDRFVLEFAGARPILRQVELNEIGMLSLHAFDVFDRIRRTSNATVSTPLTTRELEVVRWTAQGKTSVEIGRILSLSDHTVNAYMTNAIKKLDCVNRTQLVAKAIRLKLII